MHHAQFVYLSIYLHACSVHGVCIVVVMCCVDMQKCYEQYHITHMYFIFHSVLLSEKATYPDTMQSFMRSARLDRAPLALFTSASTV